MFRSLTANVIAPGATGGPLYLTKNGAGAPPYTFAGDTDTGWDSDAANTLSAYTSGTLRLTLNTAALTSTLPYRAPAGTAAAPSLQIAGVDGTGGLGGGLYGDADTWFAVSVSGGQALKLALTGLRIPSDSAFGWSSGALPAAPDLILNRVAAGIMGLNAATLAAGAALEMYEQTAPSAPAANALRLYAKDVAGKTGLYVLFASGAEQQIKVEA